jgi:hypothetical protein
MFQGSPGQMLSATSRTSLSFAIMSSLTTALPSSWLAKPAAVSCYLLSYLVQILKDWWFFCWYLPHCGDTPSLLRDSFSDSLLPSATCFAASKTLFFMSSNFSISGNLEVMIPSITFLCGGSSLSGSKPPALGVSYSR